MHGRVEAVAHRQKEESKRRGVDPARPELTSRSATASEDKLVLFALENIAQETFLRLLTESRHRLQGE